MSRYYSNRFYLNGVGIFLHFGYNLLFNRNYFVYDPAHVSKKSSPENPCRSTSAGSI